MFDPDSGIEYVLDEGNKSAPKHNYRSIKEFRSKAKIGIAAMYKKH